VLERLKVTTKLVEATTKIREQNQRLFEAGEISLDRVILSQQELDRDRKILVTLTNEENLLRAEMGLSTLWSLPPNSSSAAGL
jgi:outer membrane protein TolC